MTDKTKTDHPTEDGFQSRVKPWLMKCFGEKISADKSERNHRFLEEALELVQACGCTDNEAHQLVDYVYGRDVGEVNQEVGGVMVTLAAHCLAHGVDMHKEGETELARVWTMVEKIRAKQAAKPKHSPLPQYTAADGFDEDALFEEMRRRIDLPNIRENEDDYLPIHDTQLGVEFALEYAAPYLNAALASRVKVKPLVWVQHSNDKVWQADTPYGSYVVDYSSPSGAIILITPDGKSTSHKTPEAAKAAAQAHHDKLVLSQVRAT